jgi:hypothetical protein
VSRWIRIGRKRVLDTRPDWRDPRMKVLRTWMEEGWGGSWTKKSEMVTPEFSSDLSRENVEYSDAPDWRRDPTYNLSRKR